MTHRERFYNAVMHKPVDRAVFDLCGSPQTIVDYDVTKDELSRLLGLTGEKQGDFCLDERVLVHLDIDTRKIGGMPTPASSHCTSNEADKTFTDPWGIEYMYTNGHYEICGNPLRDATFEEIEAYEFPNPDNIDMTLLEKWAGDARYLHENTDYAVVAEHPVLGVFELGCWMFGFDDFLYRCAGEPETVRMFFDRVLAYQKKVIEKYYIALGPYIDCTTSGDDFGTQTGPFLSKDMFQELIKPYYMERVQYTKRFTKAFYKHHTCGSVYDFIPDLIDCGVDILNPIQPGVYMMEHERLKKDFGDKITFWGGIDTQHLLPAGNPEDVKKEVQRILSIMDHNGGYILSPAHTIQYDVPAQNVLALYEGAKEYYAARKDR